MNFSVATNTVEQIGANVTDLIGTFSGVIALIIGMLVAFFVIQFIIDILRGNKGRD